MYFVYVLKSLSDGMHYVGMTGKNIGERLDRHNRGEYRFTKGHRPWKVVYQEAVYARSSAVKRERYLKSGVGRHELKKLVGDSN